MRRRDGDYTAIIVRPVMEPMERETGAMPRIWSTWDAPPEITPMYGSQYWHTSMKV
jgi:hypothetical protein